MPGFRANGRRGMQGAELNGGDTLLSGDVTGTLATGGLTGTLLAAVLTGGVVVRTGPSGAFTDTTESASAIVAALAGESPAGPLVPGMSFRCRYINLSGQTATLAFGSGIISGLGNFGTVANNTWKDLKFTLNCVMPDATLICALTSGSKNATFVLRSGQSSISEGPGIGSPNIMVGAYTKGTGIAGSAPNVVAGLVWGQGGLTGFTLTANATSTQTATGVTFGASVTVDDLGSGTI